MYTFKVKVIIPHQKEINFTSISILPTYWGAYLDVQVRTKLRYIMWKGVNIFVKRHENEI